MDSEAPTASWHPAMMPHTDADIVTVPETADQPETSDAPGDVGGDATIGAPSTFKPIGTSESHSSAGDDWFPDYEAGSPWQPQSEIQQPQERGGHVEEAQPEFPVVTEETTDVQAAEEPTQPETAQIEEEVPNQPAEAVPVEEISPAQEEVLAESQATEQTHDVRPTPAFEVTQAPSGPKHVSNDSFARTVSHQPDLMSDEDDAPEWKLPRAETDLFKFMPPNERTNSFPVVPQLEHQEDVQQFEPLPTNQAEDIINEIEHENESLGFDDNSAPQPATDLQEANFWGDDNEDVDFSAQVGGDIQNEEEEASDARYTEGLPLIHHDQADGVEEHESTDPRDPFSEDAIGEGDDFFAQIGGDANNEETTNFSPGPLERKSTMQVLNGLGSDGPAGAGGPLESPMEQDEDELLDDEQPPNAQEKELTAAETSVLAPEEPKPEDLEAKWSEAFAEDEDDDFLLEDEPAAENQESKTFDPSAFFGDDDEGFLEDDDVSAPQVAPAPPLSAPVVSSQPSGTNNKYLPSGATQVPATHPANPYFPSASPMIPQVAPNPYAVQPPQQSIPAPYGAPPPRPAVNKAQSFVDKAKGGYSSPYDLPMEVVKPRKRASYQQLPAGGASASTSSAPPPRSTSFGPLPVPSAPSPILPPQGPPQMARAASGVSPPISNHSGQSPSLPKPPHQLQSKASFFEDLPSSNKTRPASRTSQKSQPSPSQATFNAPPPGAQPSPLSMPTPPQEPSASIPPVAADISRLVPPPPTNPYAALPAAASSAPSIVPPSGASRYSPAASTVSLPNGAVPPPSRYSPAPPVQRVAGYGATAAAAPPSALPHLPRTSSPLAHFEARPAAAQTEPVLQPSRSTSSLYEPRLNRMPSLPPTREVEEEDAAVQTTAGVPPPASSHAPPRARQNAPPRLDSYDSNSMSPPKRKISYGGVSGVHDIAPPPRSQTGSPTAMYGLRSPIKASEISPRPSSAHGPAPPSIASAMATPAPATSIRPRALSQKFNLIPPTDGRELDPLQRWKGVPLISWGVGGALVTSFPVEIPRYGMNQPGPMIVRSPGEIKVKTIKEVQPLEERLAKFPGPLKGKSKKKEAAAWLSAGIEELEKGLPNLAFQTQLSHEEKRSIDRVLLWKILRVMIENDGLLEGNATVDKAVRDVLSLKTAGDDVAPSVYAGGSTLGGFEGDSSSTQMKADSVDAGTIERLKKALLAGDRENAVWDAADKRLWGHALLIANTVSPELYHKVSQEFIKKEVNFPGHNNESLAALYSVLSGNHEESVDELVPVHARAGLQLMPSSTGPVSNSGLDGLEKWRETLTLILSNRSNGDAQALNSLGNLLAGYGRAEAAHICYLFSRSVTVFGGLDDPRAQFVLVGADHKTQAQQFFKETEALLLSEVYEYGLGLTGAPSLAYGVPHLAVYKLQHAMTLVEHGFRDKALQYCDVLLKDMSAQTKRSPYHHLLLESAVEDLRQRILQAPNKEASGSWISKPSMNKVSDTMWSRFNKFVAGDEADAPGQGSPKFGEETGPFAGLTGGTPTVSRPASRSNATGMEMFSASPNGYASVAPSLAPNMSPVMTRAASRYAPAAAMPSAAASPYEPNNGYTPSGRSSMERTSGEYTRSPYEPRRSSEIQAGSTGSYVPSNMTAPVQDYPDPALGISNRSPYQPAPPSAISTTAVSAPIQPPAPQTPSFSPYAPLSQESSPYAPAGNNASSSYMPTAPTTEEQPPPSAPQSNGYEPPSLNITEEQPAEPTEQPASLGGYEPPSYQPYGYEPPSYQPDLVTTNDDAEDDEKLKPKKKSFMDDDDDDYPTMAASKTAEKSKTEKDRENEELFRKAAEEDGEFTLRLMFPMLLTTFTHKSSSQTS